MAAKQKKPAPAQKSLLERLRPAGQKIIDRAMGTSLPEIMLVATLSLSRYIQNSDFSYPSEVVLNIVLFAVLLTPMYYLFRLILRSRLAAHVAGLLLSYAWYGYTYSFPSLHRFGDSLIPNSLTPFTTAVLLSLFLAIVFGVIGFAVDRLSRLRQLKDVPVLKFLLFVVAFIFVVQVVKVGGRVWTIRHDLAFDQPTTSLGTASSKVSKKPNVYYLLFDRYASPQTLQTVYHYDNSAFLSSLQDQGFYIRQNAFANYPFTMQSVSSTLSAGYHTKLSEQFKNDSAGFQTAFPYRQALDHSPVTGTFQANGYQYNQVSSWWDFTRDNASADTNPSKSFRIRAFGKNYWATDLQRDIINKSILSPLLLKGLSIGKTTVVQYQLDRNPAQNFYAEMNALKTIAKNSTTQTKPQFTFAHVLSPHDPYIFDAEGEAPTYDGNRTDNGIDEYQKYVNQLTYVNTQFTRAVKNIRADDPSAVIVIQADEGPYPKAFRGTLSPGHYYDPINLSLADMRQKFGTMAAYYLPGVDQTTQAAQLDAHVNTFRVVLNQYLGYKLPLLPDCNYTAGDKYNLFTYHLVTGKLKDTTNPTACSQYGT